VACRIAPVLIGAAPIAELKEAGAGLGRHFPPVC
jgi:hypothetical protein